MFDILSGKEEIREEPKEAPVKKKTKSLLIRRTPGMAMQEIYYEGGGEVPGNLSGVYTSQLMAQKDIDMYLARRKR